MTKNQKFSKSQSVIISISAYVAATLVGVCTYIYGPDAWGILPRLALSDTVATVFIFGCSAGFKNSSLYDPYWSVKPGVFAVAFPVLMKDWALDAYDWMMCAGMMAYAVRLTTNFYRDWPGLIHEDWRYRALQKKTGQAYWLVSLFGIHIFPTVQVFLACLPAYFVLSTAETHASPLVTVVGVAILWFSVILAYIADEQMRTFRRESSDHGQIMKVGLWRKSRHPNYLGECLTWVGLWIMALGQSMELWWTGIGAVAILVMFYGVSIPWMDRRSIERRPGFNEYMKETGRLWPKL